MLASQGRLRRPTHYATTWTPCPDRWDGHDRAPDQYSSGIASFTDQPWFDPMKAATPADTVPASPTSRWRSSPGRPSRTTTRGTFCSAWSSSVLGVGLRDVPGAVHLRAHGHDGFGVRARRHPEAPVGYRSAFAEADALDMSVPYAAGGLYSTVLDLRRWVNALDAHPRRRRGDAALRDAASPRRRTKALSATPTACWSATRTAAGWSGMRA